MIQDILVQLVDAYLHARGYFTLRTPSPRPVADRGGWLSERLLLDARAPFDGHSHASSLDHEAMDNEPAVELGTFGYHPRLEGHDRVWVISCLPTLDAMDVDLELQAITDRRHSAPPGVNERPNKRSFRALTQPRCGQSLVDAVYAAAGTRIFTHVTAVASLSGDRLRWEANEDFVTNIGGNAVRLVTFAEMFRAFGSAPVGTSNLGRTVALLEAVGYRHADSAEDPRG